MELDQLEIKYLNLMEYKISIKEFESWIYNSEWLEGKLGKDEYLELISLNYNSRYARYELDKILTKILNMGRIETFKMLILLKSIIERDGDEAKSLIRLYDLYCDGYYFLIDLGLGIGLAIEVPTESGTESFYELNDDQKIKLVNSFYPAAKELAEELRDWLLSGELKLTGKRDSEMNRWQFIDNRKEEDRQSRLWKEVARDEKTGIRKKNILLDKSGYNIEEKDRKKKWKWWQRIIR